MLDLLLPPRCVLCDRGGEALCASCARRLEEPPASPPPDGLDELTVLCSYGGAGRDLVLAIKRGNRRAAVGLLATALAGAVTAPAAGTGVDPPLVTWAPTTPERRRRRGFDQSELLARAVARSTGLRCVGTLHRLGPAQMGGTLEQRKDRAAFRARRPVPPSAILLDDVVASGATMTAAADALRRAGARWIHGLAVARSSAGPA